MTVSTVSFDSRLHVPDEVLVRELALYADRIDVSEEHTRLAVHLDALDGLIASDDDALLGLSHPRHHGSSTSSL